MKLNTPISQPEHSATQFAFRRIRKGFTYTAILSLSLISTHTLAQSKTAYAHVTSVVPIYETLTIREPYQECYLEKHIKKKAVQHYYTRSSATPTIIGALIGGAIGNELGHNKSNKKVGAVAGAILAGSIANDLTSRTQTKHHSARNAYNSHAPYKPHKSRKHRTEKVCETHYSVRHEKQVAGYDVVYRYHGQKYNTLMNSHPGKRIRVAVDITPIDY